VYVTHRVREHGASLWRLLAGSDSAQGFTVDTVHKSKMPGDHICTGGDAVILVCGSAKRMPADVQAALQEVIMQHGRLDKEAAAAYIKKLQATGRYMVEAWA
jgi:sulfite reductase alpha subunit-like flavoprotein